MSTALIGPAKIPSIGFGTFLLEQDTVADMVSAALAEGFRHIDTLHWAGKGQSLSNGKCLKRALGAARNRDRSRLGAGLISSIEMASSD